MKKLEKKVAFPVVDAHKLQDDRKMVEPVFEIGTYLYEEEKKISKQKHEIFGYKNNPTIENRIGLGIRPVLGEKIFYIDFFR